MCILINYKNYFILVTWWRSSFHSSHPDYWITVLRKSVRVYVYSYEIIKFTTSVLISNHNSKWLHITSRAQLLVLLPIPLRLRLLIDSQLHASVRLTWSLISFSSYVIHIRHIRIGILYRNLHKLSVEHPIEQNKALCVWVCEMRWDETRGKERR